MRSFVSGPYLRSGKLLGIIAFSAPTEVSRLQTALEYLKALGAPYKIALDPAKAYGKIDHLFSSDGAQARAKALHELANDPAVDVVLAVRGAYGAAEILPHLNFDLLAKTPKALVGFSDTTALLSVICQRAGWRAIHGPSLESAFSKAPTSEEHKKSASVLFDVMSAGVARMPEIRLQHFCAPQLTRELSVAKGFAGGNLSTLVSMVGSPWQPDLSGAALFIEESGEKPYRVHRMLLQMKFAGMLESLSAVVLGQFTNCVHADNKGPTVEQSIRDVLEPLKITVLSDYPAGHVPYNLPVPFGVPLKIGRENKIVFGN